MYSSCIRRYANVTGNTVYKAKAIHFCHKTCFRGFLVPFLCHLAYHGLFSLFTFLRNGLLTATLPWGPFLMKLRPTVDGSTEGQEVSLGFCVRFLLHLFLQLKSITSRYCSTTVDSVQGPETSFFVLHMSSFLIFYGQIAQHGKMCQDVSEYLFRKPFNRAKHF